MTGKGTVAAAGEVGPAGRRLGLHHEDPDHEDSDHEDSDHEDSDKITMSFQQHEDSDKKSLLSPIGNFTPPQNWPMVEWICEADSEAQKMLGKGIGIATHTLDISMVPFVIGSDGGPGGLDAAAEYKGLDDVAAASLKRAGEASALMDQVLFSRVVAMNMMCRGLRPRRPRLCVVDLRGLIYDDVQHAAEPDSGSAAR